MTYYPDLTRYVYSSRFFKDPNWTKSLNIGWLEKGQPFKTGDTPPAFLDGLRRFTEARFEQTRGLHPCDFCTDDNRLVYDLRDGVKRYLASAQIRVIGTYGKLYCSPTLIIHYVEAHNYRPPDEFIKAVINGPFPDDEDYISFFMRRDISFHATAAFKG